MELTKNHIAELYSFTRKHYVYHYDIQTELVDHLANDIEQIWKETPQLSFEDAKNKSFKKFGVFGFMDVVESKQKVMNKYYWKLIWRFTREWFIIPKIVLTVSLFLSILLLIQIPNSEYFILFSIGITIIFEMMTIYKFRKKKKMKEKKNEKIFLLETMIGTTKNGYTGLLFINFYNLIALTNLEFSSYGIHGDILIAIITTLLFILFYISNYVLPLKSQELLEEAYPEYKC